MLSPPNGVDEAEVAVLADDPNGVGAFVDIGGYDDEAAGAFTTGFVWDAAPNAMAALSVVIRIVFFICFLRFLRNPCLSQRRFRH